MKRIIQVAAIMQEVKITQETLEIQGILETQEALRIQETQEMYGRKAADMMMGLWQNRAIQKFFRSRNRQRNRHLKKSLLPEMHQEAGQHLTLRPQLHPRQPNQR